MLSAPCLWSQRPRSAPSRNSVKNRLLILDVDGPRKEREHVCGLHQFIAGPRVVAVEELEPGELDGIARDIATIRLALHPRWSPSIHVNDDLHPRVHSNAGVVRERVELIKRIKRQTCIFKLAI